MLACTRTQHAGLVLQQPARTPARRACAAAARICNLLGEKRFRKASRGKGENLGRQGWRSMRAHGLGRQGWCCMRAQGRMQGWHCSSAHAEKVPKQLHAENECTHARICNLLGEKRFRKARQVEGRGKILGGRAGAASARTVSCRAGDACGRMDAGRALLQQRARRAQAARTHTRMHAEQVSQHLHA